MTSSHQLQSVTLAGDQIQPSKIVCVGRNYAEHIVELNNQIPSEPIIFVKPNSAISDILALRGDDEVHYEAELAFIILSGKVAGVGIALDLTKRALQTKLKEKGLPWERAKAFDGSALFSDFVRLNDISESIQLALFIDNNLVQQGGYKQMMYKPNALVAEIQTFMSLCDGDILLTGTPKGVGEVSSGQHFVGQVLVNDKVIVEKQWRVIDHL